MLSFSRTKTIGVQAQGDSAWVAHARLDDALYTIDLEVEISRADMTVVRADSKLTRYTTYRCPLAEPFPQKALGKTLGPELDRLLKDEIGKPGCRHLANLFLDSAQAVARAELTELAEAATVADPEVKPEAILDSFATKYPALADYIHRH